MATEWKEKMEKRQEARISELERKKQERAERIRPEENPELLLSVFVKEKAAIENMLCDLDGLERSVLRDRLDDATKLFQKLQKFVSDSFTFLPSYDVKNMQAEIKKLQQELNEKRSSLMPKKKFAFSKKKPNEENEKTNLKADVGLNELTDSSNTSTAKETKQKSTDAQDSVCFRQQIVRHEKDLLEKDISFSNLKECTLTLYGSPLALHLEKLESCKVFCGPVSGSVFINNCKNCVFVFPCQQLRVHDTVKSQFYLHVTSRAIIEDSNELGFSQFNWKYDGMDDHFETSRLDRTKNNWQFVDDFNWLKTEEHSPNWHIISDEHKVTSWND
ncbi:tubulin-specific chaperone C-like [Dendronephthya gigantea]|uniref:tubulin-specific chaperone C-like n=1 Tax=Dendronephthya gigantea TaxID=151771 RepID=UPI00106A55F4|nr:tubulin-specific chaperone C-like [Dendronephthya gigantea]